MSSDLDTTRIVRAWLQTNEHESADRVLTDVLAALDATRQHPSWWPERGIGRTIAYAKLALAASVVVAVAVVGAYLLLPGGYPSVGAPTESPSPSLRASPMAEVWLTGPYEMGRHRATLEGISFSFETPSEGWFSGSWTGMLEKGQFPSANYGWVGFTWVFDRVSTDPCAGEATAVGPSVDDLATAMTTIPGTEALEPTDVTVGGLPAKLVEFTINDDIPCNPSKFWIYGQGSAYPNALDSTIRTWIFEVDGKRTGIHTDVMGANPELWAEIQQVIDSVEFEE